jgi:hypothetical protein
MSNNLTAHVAVPYNDEIFVYDKHIRGTASNEPLLKQGFTAKL